MVDSKSEPQNKELISIETLDLSVRSINALTASGIKFVDQLESIKETDLIKIPNLGKKSANQIKDMLSLSGIDLKNNTPTYKSFSNIAETFDELLDGKFNNNKNILINRIFNNHTLEKCGHEAGVTRERIRQIESKFFKVFEKKINDDYLTQVAKYFDFNSGINGFIELSEIGPAYTNILKYLMPAKNPKVFLNKLFKDKNLIKWQKKKKEYYFFPHDSISLDELVNDNELMLFINSSSSIKLIDSVRAYCLINDQEKNFDYIFDMIQKKLSKRVNVATLYATTQLKKNQTYISIDEIINFLKENCNKDFSSQKRTINNILCSSDIDTKNDLRNLHLYIKRGSGNFFFLDKIGIPIADKNIIIDFVIGLLEKDPNKNFNSTEFVNHFQANESLSIRTLNNLDTFLIDAILLEVTNEYDILNYVGRSSWSGNTNQLKQKRIEIYPTVMQIIDDYGKPMTVKKIKKELFKVRGSSTNFQLHTTLSTPNLIQISQGVWGLRDRDINITKGEEQDLVDSIKKEFNKGNNILDFDDLVLFKKSLGLDENISIYQLTKTLLAHIPVGRRRTPEKLIFLFKNRNHNPLNFCLYNPIISDKEAGEYLKKKINDKFLDVRNNQDSIPLKREFSNRVRKSRKSRKSSQEYVIEGKFYLGRDAVAKEYGISNYIVYYRAKSDKYPHWKAIKD